MTLNNREITGFKCSDAELFIFDEQGRTFYYFDNVKGGKITFNLPKGNFSTLCEVEKLSRPVKYICPALPKPDKKIIPLEMNFEIVDNPNKVSIDVKTGDVFIDPSIAEMETPFFNFVLFHEVGHNYYNGGEHEHFCDIFAAKMMLEKYGFNPSQCYLAQEFCLSENSIDRKNFLYNYLLKVKKI